MAVRSARRAWRSIMVAASLAVAGPLAHAATPADIPVADFFRTAQVRNVQLSPDGRHIAAIVPSTMGDGRATLAVASVETPQKFVVAAHFNDDDVAFFQWVNHNRLVFTLYDSQAALGLQQGSGLYAVNLDGTEFKWLIGRERFNYKSLMGREGVDEQALPPHARPLESWLNYFNRVLRDGSEDVLIERYEQRRRETDPITSRIVRLNTLTRAWTNVSGNFPPTGARDWILDAKDEARAVMTSHEGRGAVLWRASSQDEWQSVVDFEIYQQGTPFTPVAFDADGQMLVIADQGNAEHTDALYRWNAETKKMAAEPLVSLKGYDVSEGAPWDPALIFSATDHRLLGLHYTTDAGGTAWFDPTMKALQAEIDALMPQTVNTIGCACGDRYVDVTATSDRQSPIYLLYDRQAKKLQLIGATRPWLDARQMGAMDVQKVKMRDGLEISVRLTQPQGKGPWPTVVLVHGGPMSRKAVWEFDPDAQFLASRGYLVVEPDFRFSTGYGQRLYRAGFKQFGLAMQDDVTDTTRWAIEKKLAIADRIAIAGASYGGYATMMGLVKEPDLYRAGINWVGVTDIDLWYTISWGDTVDSPWAKYGMPQLIGDREKDRAQLDATSPLKQAARITKPVLMAYGGRDRRVPAKHGELMRDALNDAGKVPVEWVLYPYEGHGFLLLDSNVDFWTRVEKFLGKNLAPR